MGVNLCFQKNIKTSRHSDSTAESKQRRGSDAESIDDSIIQNKIKEANQLIDRVKKALGKIKSRKACEAPINHIEVKSSSTDIEETIRALKKETEQLITGNDDEPVRKTWKIPCNSCPADKAAFDRQTLNSNDFHETEKPRTSRDPHPTSEGVNFVAPPSHNKGRTGIETIDFQRPKTRRNEADDDYSGPLRRDKFCTRPEMEHLQITSSFEELQERLETISETTESSYSTPKAKKALIRDQQHKYCSTEPLCAETKEVQVEPETSTTGVCCSCPSENKKAQTGCLFLIKDVAVETLPPTPKRLQIENLAAEDIPPSRRRCNNCQVELLPVLEILPAPQKLVCDKCRMTLHEENVPGVSLPSKSMKLQRLTIKVLPPIIIKQGLTLRQVLNLSIDPNGKSINQVENTENVVYIATTSNDHRVYWSCRKQEDVWFSNKLREPLNEENDVNLGADEESVALEQSESCIDVEKRKGFDKQDQEQGDVLEDYLEPDVTTFNQIVRSNLDKTENVELTIQSSPQSSLSHDETLIEEIDNDEQFVSKSQLRPSGDIDDLIAGLVNPEKLNPELEEQLRNRILWYKSYHIYDNPNKHDPGPLDQKSMEKISQMDLKFYKTFINPNPTLSEELFTPRESRNQLMGFESKTVQCNESMLLEEQKPYMPSRFRSDDDKASFMVNREKELDSTVTVLRMKDADLEDDKKASKPMQSNYVMRGSYPESDSSPSEITVTISYTVSSDDKAQNSQDSEKSISELHETEVKTLDLEEYQELPTDQSQTNPEAQDKWISLKDKEVISKLRDKLKCVDTSSSQPTFTLKKQSADEATVDQFLKGLTTFNELDASSNEHSIDSNSKDPQTRHNVNYLLSQEVSAGNGHVKHLELGANGRYRDEEDLFAQVPYPKMSKSYKSRTGVKPLVFDHRDKEVARDKFEMVPRHRLRRYSPDTSNSDTVTTNSISEGEILCKHSVSNGEIHACRHSPPGPRLQRTILTKRNVWLPPTHCAPYNLPSGAPRKFDLDDPKVITEQRRNYFNNWVTYYVKPQDVHESTTSSCSHNK